MRATTPGRVRLLVVIGLAISTGCGDDDPPSDTDAGADADAAAPDAGTDTTVEDPAEPTAPGAAALTPCPDGWTESGTDPVECLPWPAESSAACEGPTALLPGSDACQPIGAPCPDGDWPDDLPAQGVWYVHPNGSPGAPATRLEPLASIREALALAHAGDVVAVAPGTWHEVVHVPGGVTLRGACVEGTRLWSDDFAMAGTVDVTRDGVVVRDLTIGGALFGIAIHGRLAGARLESVLIESATTFGAGVWEGGHLDAQDVIIRDTAENPETLVEGRGIEIESGGTARLERSAIETSHDIGVFVAHETSVLEMVDSVVRDTQPEVLSGRFGRGLEAELGAQVTLERVVFERNLNSAVFAGDGTSLQLTDVRIVDTSAGGQVPVLGHGIDAAGDATVTGTRVLVERATDSGLDVSEGARVTIDHLVVRDTRPGPGDAFGRGLSIQTGGQAEIGNAIISGSHESGAFVGGATSGLRLSDCVIRDTLPQESDGMFGRGVNAFDGATVTLERVSVDGSHEAGVALLDVQATVRDLLVSGTMPQRADGLFGRGVVVQGDASVGIERLLVHDCREAGVAAIGPGAHLEASDVDVRDMAGSPLGFGRGLVVQSGAVAVVTRMRLQNSHEVALLASEEASSLTGTDVQILDTLVRDCEGNICEAFGAGIGLGVYQDAHVQLTRFRIERAALLGLQLARGGTADLSQGVVAGCPIGANVQTEGFDSARLTDRVVYRDNERNFDGAELPVPL